MGAEMAGYHALKSHFWSEIRVKVHLPILTNSLDSSSIQTLMYHTDLIKQNLRSLWGSKGPGTTSLDLGCQLEAKRAGSSTEARFRS